jgi:hypothetical protein
MRIVSVLHENRKMTAPGLLLGLLALTSGCGGSGESNVASPTPPPGFSAQDQEQALKNAYGPKGVPKPVKLSAARRVR